MCFYAIKSRSRTAMPHPKTVKLKGLEDLIHVLTIAQMPILHHVAIDSKHVYFVPVSMLGDIEIVYYVESPRPLKGRFILYNTYTGKVEVSDHATSDSRITVVPIVEVEKHNLFQEKIFLEEKERKKKKEAHGKNGNGRGSLEVVLGRVKRGAP